MKYLLIIIVLYHLPVLTFAQNRYQKTFGISASPAWGQPVIIVNDDCFLTVGFTDSFGAGYSDMYLVKSNNKGQILWTRTYGGASAENISSITETDDGGFVLCGSTSSFGEGNLDIYIVKINSKGDTLWTRTYGGPDEDHGSFISKTADGGYIITGTTFGFNSSSGDMLLLKIDKSGRLIWSKAIGDGGYENPTAVFQTVDGGYIVSGQSSSFSSGSTFFMKADSMGLPLWSRMLAYDFNYSFFSKQTKDGGWLIAGQGAGAGQGDAALLKVNAMGRPQWVKSFGRKFADLAYSAMETSENTFVLTGMMNVQTAVDIHAELLLVKMDAAGNDLWARTYGSPDYERGLGIIECNDKGYLVVGESTNYSTNLKKMYIVKTDKNGVSACNDSLVTLNGVFHDTSGYKLTFSYRNIDIKMHYTYTIVDSGGEDNIICEKLSVQENLKLDKLNIFPNPANNELHVVSNMQEELTYSLYDCKGSLFLKGIIPANPTTPLNIGDLPPGIYLLKLASEKGYRTTKVIIGN